MPFLAWKFKWDNFDDFYTLCIALVLTIFFRAADRDDKCEFAYETLGTIEVQRGNLKKAIELFEKAIPLANTELEMGHLFGLRDAAIAQTTVSAKLGITLPGMMGWKTSQSPWNTIGIFSLPFPWENRIIYIHQ